jgi:hypothetical protein
LTEQFVYRRSGGKIEGGKGFFARSAPVFLLRGALDGVLILSSTKGVLFLLFRWHPLDVIGLHALPLCGAAPTFLCRREEK